MKKKCLMEKKKGRYDVPIKELLGAGTPAHEKPIYLYYDSDTRVMMKRKEPKNVRICDVVKLEFDDLKNVFP